MKTLAAQPIQIGIDSFVSAVADSATGLTMSPVERMRNLLEEVERADQVGLDAFGVGEHHRREFFDSAPAVILAAAAARTKHIRLNSAVTVLSADDPVRVFQSFATLDLISGGRAEMVVGRGSFARHFRSSASISTTMTRSLPRNSTCCCTFLTTRSTFSGL